MIRVEREGSDAGKTIGGVGAGGTLVDASRAESVVAEMRVGTCEHATGVAEEVRTSARCAGACGGDTSEAVVCT